MKKDNYEFYNITKEQLSNRLNLLRQCYENKIDPFEENGEGLRKEFCNGNIGPQFILKHSTREEQRERLRQKTLNMKEIAISFLYQLNDNEEEYVVKQFRCSELKY